MEKEADIEQFRQKIIHHTLRERVELGYSWYPVAVTKQGYIYGDRAYVILQRTTDPSPDHFRSGKLVQLFTRQAEAKRPELRGLIHYCDRQKMKVILSSRELPNWLDMGMIGVDLLFDERPYLEMERALKEVLHAAPGSSLARLRDVLYGKTTPTYRETLPCLLHSTLNDSQQLAVRQILAAEQVALIHGPPGTGKTTTVVAAVQQLSEIFASLLVCAPSNTAVDLLCERLDAAGLRVVRIGHISRVDERIISLTLDHKLATHSEAKTIKKVKIEARELRRQAKRWKRSFQASDRRERGQLFRQASELDGWARQLEQRLIAELLDDAQVVCSTLIGAGSGLLEKRQYPMVVIDEAAQAMEPATWIPILRAHRVVLAGDPCQLPPTVHSRPAALEGLAMTLLEKSLGHGLPSQLLTTQYRMNETIMGFSNAIFYADALKADASVAKHRLDTTDDVPVLFIDTAGTGADEQLEPKHQSRYNPLEFQLLREHLYQLAAAFPAGKETLPSIALISPYREQVIYMRDQLSRDEAVAHLPITIQTIDGFQGQERDVVFLSLVRSNSKGEIGFLKDYRRMNVAMTRARKQLIVTGDSGTIGGDPFYQRFLDYVEAQGDYRSGWAYMQS